MAVKSRSSTLLLLRNRKHRLANPRNEQAVAAALLSSVFWVGACPGVRGGSGGSRKATARPVKATVGLSEEALSLMCLQGEASQLWEQPASSCAFDGNARANCGRFLTVAQLPRLPRLLGLPFARSALRDGLRLGRRRLEKPRRKEAAKQSILAVPAASAGTLAAAGAAAGALGVGLGLGALGFFGTTSPAALGAAGRCFGEASQGPHRSAGIRRKAASLPASPGPSEPERTSAPTPSLPPARRVTESPSGGSLCSPRGSALGGALAAGPPPPPGVFGTALQGDVKREIEMPASGSRFAVPALAAWSFAWAAACRAAIARLDA